MIQTIFEEMGGTYSQHGEYLLPNLLLLQEEESTELIGTWGKRHWAYIRQYKQVQYTNLLTSGKLYSYLADVGKSSSRSRTRVWRSNQPTSAPFYLPCQNRAKMAHSCAKKG